MSRMPSAHAHVDVAPSVPSGDGVDAQDPGARALLDECYRAREIARRHLMVFRAIVEHLGATVRTGDRDRARELFVEADAEWRLAEKAMLAWGEAMRRARGG